MTSRFDLGEPVFYVVEPGSLVGWRVVEVPFGVSGEELLNPFDLMRRQVVRDNMDLLAARLLGDQIGKEGPQTPGWCEARTERTSASREDRPEGTRPQNLSEA
jgi:hypothetical protein